MNKYIKILKHFKILYITESKSFIKFNIKKNNC